MSRIPGGYHCRPSSQADTSTLQFLGSAVIFSGNDLGLPGLRSVLNDAIDGKLLAAIAVTPSSSRNAETKPTSNG
jgi:hypothetical protein